MTSALLAALRRISTTTTGSGKSGRQIPVAENRTGSQGTDSPAVQMAHGWSCDRAEEGDQTGQVDPSMTLPAHLPQWTLTAHISDRQKPKNP